MKFIINCDPENFSYAQDAALSYLNGMLDFEPPRQLRGAANFSVGQVSFKVWGKHNKVLVQQIDLRRL